MLLCAWHCDKCCLTSVPETSQGWSGRGRHPACNMGERFGPPWERQSPRKTIIGKTQASRGTICVQLCPCPQLCPCTGFRSPLSREGLSLSTSLYHPPPPRPPYIPLSQNPTVYFWFNTTVQKSQFRSQLGRFRVGSWMSLPEVLESIFNLAKSDYLPIQVGSNSWGTQVKI